MIGAAHLTRRFESRTAVDDVTIEIGRGEIVALLGPNGAGKTTTLRMLAGLISPTSGTISIDGVQLTRDSGATLRARIGFLTEAPGLWDRLTVRENLATYAGLYGLPSPARAADEMLARFGLIGRASPRAAELSKGMRQQVALGRALMHRPRVLLLDEPTAGLDPEITKSVRALLAERRAAGCAILVSTHNLDEAERIADRVAVLHQRLLAVDTPAALRRRLDSGRVLVRVDGDPHEALTPARTFDADATASDTTLSVQVHERDTPALVAALVAHGTRILEVRRDTAALEDVYLQLMDGR